METSLALVELACVALLALSAGLRARAPGAREWLADAPVVALAAWVGEASSIQAYSFYFYAPGWHLFLGPVPLLIPLIWVFVVLSARDVARALGGRPWATSFALVLFDAALIEPTSTSAGLWRWTEPGAFAVPYVGVVGWACFGASALYWLGRLRGPARWLTVLLAPLCMHGLLLVLWWGCFKWVGRAEAEAWHAAAWAWAVSLALVALLVLGRRAQSVALGLILPRLGPAAFFLALLAVQGAPAPLWVYGAAFVPPWLVVTAWTRAHHRTQPLVHDS